MAETFAQQMRAKKAVSSYRHTDTGDSIMEGFLEELTSEFSLKGTGLTGAEGQETPPLVAGHLECVLPSNGD